MPGIPVNNAGTILRKPAAEHPDEYWDKVIEVNQNARFILTRKVGCGMPGAVVFPASNQLTGAILLADSGWMRL